MKIVKINPYEIGFISLVGFLKEEFPMKHGNYFSCDGYYIMNMWYENLEYLKQNNIIKIGDKLEGVAFDKGLILTDKKIPPDFLTKKYIL
jgi:hypothetical protein